MNRKLRQFGLHPLVLSLAACCGCSQSSTESDAKPIVPVAKSGVKPAIEITKDLATQVTSAPTLPLSDSLRENHLRDKPRKLINRQARIDAGFNDSVEHPEGEEQKLSRLSWFLRHDLRSSSFKETWEVAALGFRGQWIVIYNRRNKTLLYHEVSSEVGAPGIKDVRLLFSGVTDEIIHLAALDHETFENLTFYGCARRLLSPKR